MSVQTENLSNENLLAAMHKYLVVEINRRRYALNVSNVKEIITLPEITPIPDSAPFERGIIKLRDSIVRIVDTRKRLKQPTVEEEDKAVIEMLKKMKEEHLHWLEVLTEAIENDRPFTLEKDPTQCNFGKWYYSYRHTSKQVTSYLSQFDGPHKHFHSLADVIESCVVRCDKARAREMLDRIRKREVRDMIKLFDGFEKFMNSVNKEVGIIFARKDRTIGISVDRVTSITEIDPKYVEAPDTDEVSIKGVARIGDQVYVILDEDKITDMRIS